MGWDGVRDELGAGAKDVKEGLQLGTFGDRQFRSPHCRWWQMDQLDYQQILLVFVLFGNCVSVNVASG